jgi:hypothetical protein
MTDIFRMILKLQDNPPIWKIIIFLGMSMNHPTSFFILENETLGTFWVGQMKMKLDECGFSLLPAVTRDQLIEKLEAKYVEYSNPCLDLVSINKNGSLPFYGVENWIVDLQYEIQRNSQKYQELDKLLKVGWNQDDFTPNSTVNVLHVRNKTDIKELYKRLIMDWEAKGMRCLNTIQCKTRVERYEKSKKDPDFLHNQARNKIISRMKKTEKIPKQSTLDKYNITFSELSQPCSSSLE